MTTYRRGDVVLVNFPFSNLTQVVYRPALVVQNDTITTGFDQWIVVQITKNINRSGAFRVKVTKNSQAGRQMNLQHDSVIMADKVATLSQREIKKSIGSCPVMAKVDQALKIILKL